MNDNNRLIFSGMQILNGKSWLKHQALIVEDGLIKAIIREDMIKHHLPATEIKLASSDFLVPGFIDLHVHGASGKDVMDANEEAFATISTKLAAEGVTGFLATTMTASLEQIDAVMQVMPKVMQFTDGAAILGVHLEGPFISKLKAGAQLGDLTRDPDIELVKQWQKLSDAAIKLLTLAPELPGAIEFIRSLRKMNIVAAIGHTDASYDQTCAAIAAGCTQATHLFNAMRAMHQREPGALGALLLNKDVNAEIIVDGAHLHPAIVDLAFRVKHKDRLILVTDAMRAKCCGNGEYELGGQKIQVKNGIALTQKGTLAGSTLRMSQAVKNMISDASCGLEDAVMMAATNPARVLGLSARKGTIEVGKDADLVVLNADLQVTMTMREGRKIYQAH